MGEVHVDFSQAHELDIPVIDLSPLNSMELDEKALARIVSEVGHACKNWGCFLVINHGVPSQALEKIELASKKFFAQSKEEKRKVRMDVANLNGYSDQRNTKKNVSDLKEFFDCTLEEPTIMYTSLEPDDYELRELHNLWPQYPPELREVCQGYSAEMRKLSSKLMELISLSLGLRKDRLNEMFKEQTSHARLNYYPVSPNTESTLGFHPHKDAGALTILAQDDVGGLEVKRKFDGQWIPVEPNPGTYIIIVADIIQIWSNDRYESVEHYVRANYEKERFSIPFFMCPSHDIWIEPLEEFVSEQNPSKHEGYRCGKYYITRKLMQFK